MWIFCIKNIIWYFVNILIIHNLFLSSIIIPNLFLSSIIIPVSNTRSLNTTSQKVSAANTKQQKLLQSCWKQGWLYSIKIDYVLIKCLQNIKEKLFFYTKYSHILVSKFKKVVFFLKTSTSRFLCKFVSL